MNSTGDPKKVNKFVVVLESRVPESPSDIKVGNIQPCYIYEKIVEKDTKVFCEGLLTTPLYHHCFDTYKDAYNYLISTLNIRYREKMDDRIRYEYQCRYIQEEIGKIEKNNADRNVPTTGNALKN